MPFQALPGLSGCFPCSPPGLSPCLSTYTAGVKTQKTHSWLHSAARPASSFLQVAPIETASARASSPFPDSPVRGSPDRALTTCRFQSAQAPDSRQATETKGQDHVFEALDLNYGVLPTAIG